jgi:3-oxoacyl-[acyl-carrier-protein] synthase-3
MAGILMYDKMKNFKLGLVTHIVTHLPEREVDLLDIAKEIPIDNKEAEKIIKTTGFSHIRQVDNETSKDLCLTAAQKLISKLSFEEINQIDVVLFVSQTRDYIIPQTSGIIQYELGLKNEVICKDIPQGCSGYVSGLMESFMFLNLGMKSVLLLAGETNTKVISHNDKSVRMVFGDGGTATLIKSIKNSSPVSFDYGYDGSGYSDLIIKSGGLRNSTNFDTNKPIEYEPGIIRSDSDMSMNGLSVMNFAIKRVPRSIKNLTAILKQDVDRYYLHQANKFMIDYLIKKSKIDSALAPFTANKIGNTGPASIPISICIDLKKGITSKQAVLTGFGVGLSWGSCNLDLSQIEYSTINL